MHETHKLRRNESLNNRTSQVITQTRATSLKNTPRQKRQLTKNAFSLNDTQLESRVRKTNNIELLDFQTGDDRRFSARSYELKVHQLPEYEHLHDSANSNLGCCDIISSEMQKRISTASVGMDKLEINKMADFEIEPFDLDTFVESVNNYESSKLDSSFRENTRPKPNLSLILEEATQLEKSEKPFTLKTTKNQTITAYPGFCNRPSHSHNPNSRRKTTHKVRVTKNQMEALRQSARKKKNSIKRFDLDDAHH